MQFINFIYKYRQELCLLVPSVIQLILIAWLFSVVATA